MREQLEQRLSKLKAEFELGQKQMEELEAQTNKLRTTLLRISGAIQVLEEELASEATGNGAVSAFVEPNASGEPKP